MNKWEKNDEWEKEYEEYLNSLKDEECSDDDCYHIDNDYHEKLESVKTIIESIFIIEEEIHFISEEENVKVKWVVDNMELKIDNIIPEKDTFCVSIHIKPLKSKNFKHKRKNIVYFYEIQDRYISRNIIYSSNCPSIFNDGEKVLEELSDALKIFLTQ